MTSPISWTRCSSSCPLSRSRCPCCNWPVGSWIMFGFRTLALRRGTVSQTTTSHKGSFFIFYSSRNSPTLFFDRISPNPLGPGRRAAGSRWSLWESSVRGVLVRFSGGNCLFASCSFCYVIPSKSTWTRSACQSTTAGSFSSPLPRFRWLLSACSSQSSVTPQWWLH